MAEKLVADPKLAVQRLEMVAKVNREIAEACDVILEVLAKHPELDKHLCKAFGIQAPMQMK